MGGVLWLGMIKINYRGFTVEQTKNGWCCEFTNTFACRTQADVEKAINKYIAGQEQVQRLLDIA